MANDSQTRALARRLTRLERHILFRKQPGLAHSSIEDGAIQSVDTDGVVQMIVGTQFDGTQTSAVVNGPTPPTPLIPGVEAQPGALRVYWDGTFVDALAAPMDFARVLVYATPLASFVEPTPLDQTIIVGQLTSATGGEVSVVLEPGTEYAVYLVTWTQAGKYSAASDIAVATTLSPLQGEPGAQGIPGPPGEDGQSLYTWLKYADTPTSGMSDSPTGKTYIGLAYNKTVQLESTDYADYQWSLIRGADGANGLDGADGVTISSTSVTYQKSSSGTIAPTGAWSASVPATSPGEFLWTRTVITFSDTTSTTAYAVAAHGSNGAPGDPGADGLDGVGISSTAVTYQVSASGTTPPTGTWSTSIPATTAGQYLWTRTITTLTDSSSSTAYSVARHGLTGSQGIQGPPGSDGATLYTWLKYADTPTSGMSDDPTGKTYIGIAYNKTSSTESSTYADYQWSLIKGADGAAGADGAQGPAGNGITGTTVTYQVGSSGTTAPTGTWTASPGATSPGQYLWTRTVTSYNTGSPTTAYSVAAHGATGSTGGQGPAGRGISSTAVTYQVGSSGTTAPTGTWTSTIPATSPGQYLWTRTITTYTDSTTSTAYSVAAHGSTGQQGIQGPPGADGQPTYTWIKYATDATGTSMSDDPTGRAYIGFAYNKTTATESTTPGDYTWSLIKGADGANGAPGADGRGISSTAVTYQVSSSGTTAPTGTWTSTIPATSPGQYLWTRTVTTYTDSSTTTSYAVGKHGDTGATGSTGATGPAGRGISSTAVTYQASTSGTTVPTGTWTTSIPATNPGDYLWTRLVITYTDSTTATTYSVARHGLTGAQGIQGPAGPAGTTTYTWVKYADTSTGGGMTDDPTGKSFIGFAFNKTTATESTVPADYQWSRYRGNDAPTVVPGAPTVKVTGTTNSLIVETSPVDVGTDLEYHISTTNGFGGDGSTVYVVTKATIAVINTLADGTPLNPDTAYYVKVRPKNAVGYGTDSAQVETALNMENLDEFVVSTIKTGFVLTGRVQLGQILIDANDGITIPQPNGGVITFPANGDAASISSHLDAFSLTVRDRLAIRGLLNEISTGSEVSLSQGVTTPTSPPAVQAAWASKTMNFAPGFELGLTGLAQYGSNWYATSLVYGSDVASIKATDANGNGITGWNLATGFMPVGGCTVIGSTLYVLGYDKTRLVAGSSVPRWFVKRYTITSNMAYAGEWEYTEASSSPYNPGIGMSQANEVVIGRSTSGGRVRLTRFNPTSGAVIATTLSNNTLGTNITSANYGTWDMGTARYIYTSTGSINACDDNGANSIAWDRASGRNVYGMTRSTADGLWYHLDSTSTRWGYSSHFSGYGATRSVAYSWFDSDTGGTGQHETNTGPATSFLQPRRAYFSVTTPPPNDTGGNDDPDSVRIWINGQRQPEMPVGGTYAVFDQPATGTTTKAAAFPTSASSARLRSGAADTLGPLIDFRGNGDFRLGPFSNARSYVRVVRTATTGTVVTATDTVMPFNAVWHAATGGLSWDAANNRIVVQQAGLYIVMASAGWPDNNTTGRRRTTLRKNGSPVDTAEDAPSNDMSQKVSAIMDCAVGDYIDVVVWQNSGANRTMGGEGSGSKNYLTATRVGA